MTKKITDFGEKIGGARKDKVKNRKNLINQNKTDEMERFQPVIRDNIWSKANDKDRIASGLLPGVAYWQNEMRKSIPAKPVFTDYPSLKNYVHLVGEIRDLVNQVMDADGVNTFFPLFCSYYLKSLDQPYVEVIDSARGIITNRLLKTAQMSYAVCEQHAKKEAYGGLTRRKPAVPKSRKLPFSFPTLSSFQRTDPSYLPERGHVSKEDFLMMGIRGVEFGQWMSDEDAQAALDHCYVAFCDLARLLTIEPSDISLGGRLSLSFGARGRCGISSTGYNSEKQVIFFTKNNSAGFLAHEWCHALDNYLSQVCLFNRIESGAFISQYVKYEGLPQAIHHLLEVLIYQDVTITASEQEQILVREHQETMYRVQNQCKSLIESITPDNLTENQQKLWDMAVREIYCMPSQHSLVLLSKLRKDLTGHGLSRNIQKTMQWNLQFFNQLEQMKIPPQKTIQEKITSFYYQHSWKMDQIFSKPAYGFYSDIREMMARAFDCYIADKLKEEGTENRYLTAYSDSFAASGENGECIFGFPVGKERKQINQAFDDAIEEMKSLGFLHQKNTLPKQFHYPEEIIHDKEEKTSIQKIKLIAAEKSSGFEKRQRRQQEQSGNGLTQ